MRVTLCGSALDNALKTMTLINVNKTAQLLDDPINPPLRRSQVHPSVLPADRCSRFEKQVSCSDQEVQTSSCGSQSGVWTRCERDPTTLAPGGIILASSRSTRRRVSDGCSWHGVVGAFAMYGSFEAWVVAFSQTHARNCASGYAKKNRPRPGRLNGGYSLQVTLLP